MNKRTFFLFLLFAIFSSNQAEAKKGLLSLFKAGNGQKVGNLGKVYTLETLNEQQLINCLMLLENIDEADKKLEIFNKQIEKQRAQLIERESKLIDLRKYLDSKENVKFMSENEVNNFNKKVDYFNKSIKEHNQKLRIEKEIENSYNAMVKKQNALIIKNNVGCHGKRYYEEDLVSAKLAVKK